MKMKNYRSRLREQGLRPIQVWVPDVRVSAFAEDLRKQVSLLEVQDEDEVLEFINEVADFKAP